MLSEFQRGKQRERTEGAVLWLQDSSDDDSVVFMEEDKGRERCDGIQGIQTEDGNERLEGLLDLEVIEKRTRAFTLSSASSSNSRTSSVDIIDDLDVTGNVGYSTPPTTRETVRKASHGPFASL